MNQRLRKIGIVLILSAMHIVAKGQISANFSTVGSTSGCSPLVVQFQNQTTGGNSSNYTYSWNLGVATSTLANPSATYNTPGTYSITLTVTDGNGSDVETKTGYITVHNDPVVNFSGSPLTGCPPLTVNFTDQSTSNAPGTSTYSWYFGGPIKSGQNTSHTYTSSGLKTITLTVTNSYGCSSTGTKTNYVNVYPVPSVNFSANKTDFCSSPAVANFTSSVTSTNAIASYAWSFGNTTANPSNINFTGTPPTSFNVGLTVTDVNGCVGTATKPGYIKIHKPEANFTMPTSACQGASVSFTNTSSPSGVTGATWDFDDGNGSSSYSTTHAFGNPGTYNVKLTYNYNGCIDTIRKTITIHPKPNVNFKKIPDTLCPAPQTVQFVPIGTGITSAFWDFGDPPATSTSVNSSHTYTQNGKYTVKFVATSNNGCTDSLTKIDFVELYPLYARIIESIDSGCIPLKVNFNGRAEIAIDTVYPYPVASWEWDFGHNGATSNQKNPSYTYTDTGVFRVILKITTVQGCIKYDTTYIRAGSKPTSKFKVVPQVVCPNEKVYFTNQSTGQRITGYRWSFGDGDISFSKDEIHRYAKPGLYNVNLSTYFHGCKDISSDTVRVLLGSADFGFKYDCDTPLKVSFSDSSVGATHFKWEFGDGTVDTVNRNPVHTYATIGTYYVLYTVYNDVSMCRDTIAKYVTLEDPTVYFTANDTTICDGDKVTFTGGITGSTSTQFFWYVNGSLVNTQGLSTYTHDVFREGYNTILLSITDGHQCEQTLQRNNYIFESHPKPNFGAAPLKGCVPVNVTFKDSSTSTTPSTIVSRVWDFGDGTKTGVLTTDTVSHLYSSRGPYDTKIIVTDNIGCKDSITIPQLVHPHKPLALFSTKPTICVGDTVEYNEASVNAVSYNWDFGDGATSTLKDPIHFYYQRGSFTPTLIVEDTLGCKDTLVGNAITIQKPTAVITMSDSVAVCPPLVVQFDGSNSIDASFYKWNLGTGNSAITQKTSDIYVNRSSYNVSLIVTDPIGCKDTANRNVRILGYSGSFTYDSLLGCKPFKVNFDANIKNVASILWDFGDGVTSVAGTKTSHTYTSVGKYLPKVIFEDANGCKASSVGLDTITVDGVFAKIFAENPCENEAVQFVDSSFSPYSPITSWYWVFQGGQQSAVKDPIVYFGPKGGYTVSLKTINANGCKDSVTTNVTIHPHPEVSAGVDTVICYSDSATLMPSGALTYLWSPNINLSCTNCTNPKAAPTSKLFYTVVGTDINGCKDTSKVAVDVKTDVESFVGKDGEICEGDSLVLIAYGANTYTWTPAATLDDSSKGNPISRPTKNTTYMVVAYEGSCKPDTNFVKVTVHPSPNVEVKGAQSIVAGTSADLLATGGDISRLEWSPAASLNCSDCFAPVASPFKTTTYIVVAYSDYGCIDSASVTVSVSCNEKQMFLPNTFTPNGDGQNDVFYPRGAGISKVVSFKIYNRWGEVVFERSNFAPNDKAYAWDGTYNGAVLPPDTYVYFVQAYCEGDELLKAKGDITIIR